jgi:putative transposase
MSLDRQEGGEQMSGADQQARRRRERAQQVGLWRYLLVQDVADPALSTRQRGRAVRQLAGQWHTDPFGTQVRLSRATIDRWIRALRSGGFEALVPSARQATPRVPEQVLELAAGLKREDTGRTAEQIVRILQASCGWSPSARTVQRHFRRLDLIAAPAGGPAVFGSFQADRCNEIWQGDALHGPVIAGRKTYLFCFIDDRSRAVMGASPSFRRSWCSGA